MIIYKNAEVSEIIKAIKECPDDKIIMIECGVCGKHICVISTCEHPKNGYCALFRLQAANDMTRFNMRKGVNK